MEQSIQTSSGSTTQYFQQHGGVFEEVYPCRCGKTHTGDYAAHDFIHHNCSHSMFAELDGNVICLDCGYVAGFKDNLGD